MNKVEAKKILSEQVSRLKKLSYVELCKFTDRNNIEAKETIGESGTRYQVEIQAMWDNKPNKNLRVTVSIDDCSQWRTIFPLAEDFIITPDGTFIEG